MTSWLVARRHADGTASAWNLANALTLLRVLLVPLMAALLLVDGGQDDGWRLAAAAAFGVAIATDKVDGEVARRHDLVTDFGKLVDPIADKALVGTALVLLSVLGELPWWVTVLVLGREVGVTLLRFVVIRWGVIPASRGGKLKTVLQSLAIALYLLPTPDVLAGWKPGLALGVMLLAVVVTVVTGADYVVSAVRLRREGRREQAARERAAGRAGGPLADEAVDGGGPGTSTAADGAPEEPRGGPHA
ncbi:CDP-alcohol phosphatidyltransferase family protein [uncultured Pseudokineococcus sp.]|uniref:CDP-alcohol phosphatidyltransferase family protein n=1 Tax=uncultured Pseudokineococcus sp. TaxID=1642928 RepID=UPI00263064FB|nr:CDP-alcohol phosphatidyltransferase family protein [uncultured Pseudokineococcus sp.]